MSRDPEDIYDDDPTLAEAITRALAENAPTLSGGPAIVTGFVVITEWVDAAGQTWLTCATSPGTPSWRRDGMLHARLHDWPKPD